MSDVKFESLEEKIATMAARQFAMAIDLWNSGKKSPQVGMPAVLAACTTTRELLESSLRQLTRFETLVQVEVVLNPVAEALAGPGVEVANMYREFTQLYQKRVELIGPNSEFSGIRSDLKRALEKRDALKAERQALWDRVNEPTPFDQIQDHLTTVVQRHLEALSIFAELIAEVRGITIPQLRDEIIKKEAYNAEQAKKSK